MKNSKAILVGLGKIGFLCDLNKKKSFLSHAKILANLKKINFVCGIDKNKKKRILFKKKFNIDTSHKLKETILKYQPSFVVVCVNTNNQFKILKDISAFKSVKNVLVEKPGTDNFDQLTKIQKIYLKRRINLFINYNRSYYRELVSLFSIFKTKKYFKTSYFYNRGFLNNCSHLLNLIFLYLENPIEIKILKKGRKFNNDIQPDLKLNFKNGEILFICNNNKKIIHNELIFFNSNVKINSNSTFTSFYKSELRKSKFIDNHSYYKLTKIIKNNKKNYQRQVYDKILKNKNFYKNKKILQSGLRVLYLYKQILLKYKKKC